MISWRHNCKMFYFNHIIKLKRSIDLVSKLRQIETTIDEHCFHNHFLYGYRLFFSKLFWLVDLFSCSNSSWLSHLKFIEIKQVFSNKMFPFYPPPSSERRFSPYWCARYCQNVEQIIFHQDFHFLSFLCSLPLLVGNLISNKRISIPCFRKQR